VHRDIKPENLFLTRHAQSVDIVKVLDFGISKGALTSGATARRDFAKTMLPMGSPAYMSPEQIRASGEVDSRTDIWSLGCVLFELITGASVFSAPTLMQLSASILEREPAKLRTYVPDAPAELEAIILRCLEKDLSKRFQNVAELAVALFPFAPRRARISAERCSYLLRNADFPADAFELSSISPPPIDLTDSATEILIQPEQRRSSILSPFRATIPDQSTFRPGRARNRALLAGAAALIAAAIGFAAWSGDDSVSAESVTASSQVGDAPPASPKPLLAPVDVAAADRAPARSGAAPKAAANAPLDLDAQPAPVAKPARQPRSVSVSPRARAPLPRVKPKGTVGGRIGAGPSHEDEPDVGY
jgi:serine/threonine-protein kinase